VILVGEMRDLETISTACSPPKPAPRAVHSAHSRRDGNHSSVLLRFFPPPEQKTDSFAACRHAQKPSSPSVSFAAPTTKGRVPAVEIHDRHRLHRDCIINADKNAPDFHDAIAAGTEPVRHANVRSVALSISTRSRSSLSMKLSRRSNADDSSCAFKYSLRLRLRPRPKWSAKCRLRAFARK